MNVWLIRPTVYVIVFKVPGQFLAFSNSLTSNMYSVYTVESQYLGHSQGWTKVI